MVAFSFKKRSPETEFEIFKIPPVTVWGVCPWTMCRLWYSNKTPQNSYDGNLNHVLAIFSLGFIVAISQMPKQYLDIWFTWFTCSHVTVNFSPFTKWDCAIFSTQHNIPRVEIRLTIHLFISQHHCSVIHRQSPLQAIGKDASLHLARELYQKQLTLSYKATQSLRRCLT